MRVRSEQRTYVYILVHYIILFVPTKAETLPLPSFIPWRVRSILRQTHKSRHLSAKASLSLPNKDSQRCAYYLLQYSTCLLPAVNKSALSFKPCASIEAAASLIRDKVLLERSQTNIKCIQYHPPLKKLSLIPTMRRFSFSFLFIFSSHV